MLVLLAALGATGCDVGRDGPLLFAPIAVIFLTGVLVRQTLMARRSARELATEQDVIAAWTCSPEVWRAYARREMRPQMTMAAVTLLILGGLCGGLHVIGFLRTPGLIVVLSLLVTTFLAGLMYAWRRTHLRDPRVVIGRDGALVAGTYRTWKGPDRAWGGASLQQDPLRLSLRWSVIDRGRSVAIPFDFEVPVPLAHEADAGLVVRRLGAGPGGEDIIAESEALLREMGETVDWNVTPRLPAPPARGRSRPEPPPLPSAGPWRVAATAGIALGLAGLVLSGALRVALVVGGVLLFLVARRRATLREAAISDRDALLGGELLAVWTCPADTARAAAVRGLRGEAGLAVFGRIAYRLILLAGVAIFALAILPPGIVPPRPGTVALIFGIAATLLVTPLILAVWFALPRGDVSVMVFAEGALVGDEWMTWTRAGESFVCAHVAGGPRVGREPTRLVLEWTAQQFQARKLAIPLPDSLAPEARVVVQWLERRSLERYESAPRAPVSPAGGAAR